VTYRVVHPSGGAVRHLRSFGKTLFTNEGKPYLIIGIIQDVTQQILHQKQLEESERELQKRVWERTQELENKNRELEQFTYAASHDMQEPLRKVATFSNYLLDKHAAQLDEKGQSYLKKIDASAKRMKTIIDDLLHYSYQTRESLQFMPTDLNEVIENIKSDLDLVMDQKGAVIDIDPLPTVFAVPNQMHQLFYNLINNGLKFSRPDLQPQIRVQAPEITDAIFKILKNPDPAKSYILITVTDNGIGFAQEHAEQIFSLFKRLHGRSEYEGTGIGLALCKKIADIHGGYIWAESTPGEGATFNVLLPAD
jgi:light-regulated signal transduction histidine kinase (bacteriophytochrome)